MGLQNSVETPLTSSLSSYDSLSASLTFSTNATSALSSAGKFDYQPDSESYSTKVNVGPTNAASCDAAWNSYSDASFSYWLRQYSTNTEKIAYTSTSTSYAVSYSIYSSCNTSISYATPITLNSSSVITQVNTITTYITTFSDYTSPKPTCTVDDADCSSIWTSFNSANNAWYAGDYTITTMTSPKRPYCQTCKVTGCTINRASVDLYYWPVTANVSRNMCAYNPTQTHASYAPNFPNTSKYRYL
jgi:hypothetical protein